MFLIDIVLILGIGVVFTLALFGYYQPKINNVKKSFNEFDTRIRNRLKEMSDSERQDFLSNLSDDNKGLFENILNDNNQFSSLEQFHLMNQHMQDIQYVHDTQFNDFTQWAMEESMKAVTPFDHGGYVQGPGFNPSDTMAHQMNNDMMDMHNMNNDSMNMHNDNNFGGF